MWANKKCKNSHIYNVIFKKIIIKKNTWRYHCFTPVYLKHWWYDLQFLRYRGDRLKLVIMGHFLPLHPPLKTQKIRILKKWKELLEISSIYVSVPKPHLYEAWFLRYRVRQTEFFAILGHFFALLPHY